MDYKNKDELIKELVKRSSLFINEFSEVKESEKDKYVEGVDRTPSQILAYQLGWMELVKKWDDIELSGKTPKMPTEDFKWNNLGGLYKTFYKKYEEFTIEDMIKLFNTYIDNYIEWIEELSEDELFIQGNRKWTGDKDNWPIARWIHINTIAPFKTFRTKIRKWKKLNNI